MSPAMQCKAGRETQYFKRIIAMETRNRRLMWHGMFLFLLGLVTGLLEQRFTNMRMGIAAHLEGVMNGTFLVVLGAIWSEVRLASPAKPTAYWGTLYATYANWMFTTLAAVFGTAASTPIASAGHHGEQPARSRLMVPHYGIIIPFAPCCTKLRQGCFRPMSQNADRELQP
jgi:(hydroxyamino)benzene mutase